MVEFLTACMVVTLLMVDELRIVGGRGTARGVPEPELRLPVLQPHLQGQVRQNQGQLQEVN